MNNVDIRANQSYPRPLRGLRIGKVQDRVGFSRGHIYKLIGLGAFPKPYKLSERVSIWDERQINDWLGVKFSADEESNASSETNPQLGHNGGPALDDAVKQCSPSVSQKKRGGENG